MTHRPLVRIASSDLYQTDCSLKTSPDEEQKWKLLSFNWTWVTEHSPKRKCRSLFLCTHQLWEVATGLGAMWNGRWSGKWTLTTDPHLQELALRMLNVMSRSCSQMKEKWGGRSVDCFSCECFTSLSWWRKSWPIVLRSYPHLWSQALGSDQKNEIVDASSHNEFPLQGVWVLPPLELGWKVWTSSSKLCYYFSTLGGASWGGSCSGCLDLGTG